MSTEASPPRGEKITCKAAARLLSDAQEHDLGAADRTRLRLHLAICEACRNVEAQFGFLRRVMRRLGQEERGEHDSGEHDSGEHDSGGHKSAEHKSAEHKSGEPRHAPPGGRDRGTH